MRIPVIYDGVYGCQRSYNHRANQNFSSGKIHIRYIETNASITSYCLDELMSKRLSIYGSSTNKILRGFLPERDVCTRKISHSVIIILVLMNTNEAIAIILNFAIFC